jgi:hypothetical protein
MNNWFSLITSMKNNFLFIKLVTAKCMTHQISSFLAKHYENKQFVFIHYLNEKQFFVGNKPINGKCMAQKILSTNYFHK